MSPGNMTLEFYLDTAGGPRQCSRMDAPGKYDQGMRLLTLRKAGRL